MIEIIDYLGPRRDAFECFGFTIYEFLYTFQIFETFINSFSELRRKNGKIIFQSAKKRLGPLSDNPAKWSNTLIQFDSKI